MSCHVISTCLSRVPHSLSLSIYVRVSFPVCVCWHSDMSWCDWGDELTGHGNPTRRRGFGERRAQTWEGAHLHRRAKTCAERDLRIGSHTAARLDRHTAARLQQDKCAHTHTHSLSLCLCDTSKTCALTQRHAPQGHH